VPGGALSYYDLLGLRPDAGSDEIRAAYDALMARIRPDAARDTASTIRLAAAVKEAWETLGDPGKRHAYDETLRGTAAYADIWRRSQQASYLEQRDAWVDEQVRRAQSERQTSFEHEAERRQLDEDFYAVAASNAAVDLAREEAMRAAEKRQAAARSRLFRSLAVVAAIAGALALVAAGMWLRGSFARKTTALPATPTLASAAATAEESIPRAAATGLRPRAPDTAHRRSGATSGTTAPAPGNASTAAQPNVDTQSRATPVVPARTSGLARPPVMAAAAAAPHRSNAAHPAYVCKTVAVATVTHDGSLVDLSDGRRYQLTDPVDKAQAGGWATGSTVAECAWPASLKRPASLDVNGYSAHAIPVAIVAAAVAMPSGGASPASICADASITQVADDGYGIALSDGHVYAVDSAGHVTAAAWLAGDAVSVCFAPAKGANAYTVARFGVVVNASRTQSLATAASAPTLCVVRLVSALAGDGSRVVFNDGHTYRVDGASGRSIVAGWALGERVTVCIKLTNGTVNATLARAGLTAHAIRAD
jgi:curved DNA-binding protein CbpA